MQDISTSFPSMSASLSRIDLNQTLLRELAINNPMGGGQTVVFINGNFIREDDIYSLYSLLTMIASQEISEEAKDVHEYILNSVKPSFVLSNSPNPRFEIIAILDPLSAKTQKLCPQLKLIYEMFEIKMHVVLNPYERSTLPLKNFYNYVAGQTLTFENGKLNGPQASFSKLPESRLLTLNLVTPDSWLVTPLLGGFDLDNLRMAESSTVSAQFQLDYLLITGLLPRFFSFPFFFLVLSSICLPKAFKQFSSSLRVML